MPTYDQLSWSAVLGLRDTDKQRLPLVRTYPAKVDPLYLFACHVEWELQSKPGAALELISAAQSGDAGERSQVQAG